MKKLEISKFWDLLTTLEFQVKFYFNIIGHHYIGGTDIVVPSPGNEGDKKAIYSLVQEMKNTNKVIIARFVSRANSDPKLVCLNPHISSSGALFYLNTLPTVEDLRDFQFESLNECTIKQEEIVSGFIDSLDLEVNNNEDEDDKKTEKLKTSDVYNPTLQYFYQCLEHRALSDQNNLPELDDVIESYMKPDKTLFENNKYVTFLPKVFDIKQSNYCLLIIF